MRRLLPVGLWTLAACATTQAKPAIQAKPVACAPCAKAEPPARSKLWSTQPSLLDSVPRSAVAALVIRQEAMAWPKRLLQQSPEMTSELSAYLRQTVGADLTTIDGLAVFATSIKPKPSGALILRLSAVPKRLRGKVVATHLGVDIISVERRLVAAALPKGLVLGSLDAVKAALAVALRKEKALDSAAALGDIFKHDGAGVDLLLGFDLRAIGAFGPQVRQFGLDVASVTLDRAQTLTLRVHGARNKLKLARNIAQNGVNMALNSLQMAMGIALQGKNVFRGVSAIVSYFQTKKLLTEIEPKLIGEHLVAQYRMPKVGQAHIMVAVAGILAAVAIPAFIKYLRKSKTVEAIEGLDRLKVGLRRYVAQHKRKTRLRIFRDTGWTPSAPCCKAGQKKCPASAAFDKQPFTSLGFKPRGAHYYQYRLRTEKKGKRRTIVLEARGDLDCDAIYSNYKILVDVDKSGDVRSRGPIISNEIE